jgi:hypothetical protein
MAQAVSFTAYLDLLSLDTETRKAIASRKREYLNEGIENFLQARGLTATASSGAELVAGPYQIELSKSIPETLALAAELLISHRHPEGISASAPAVVAWLNGIYESITRIDSRNGAFCVYRSLLNLTDRPLITTALDVASVCGYFPCKSPRTSCKHSTKGICTVTSKDIRSLLDELVGKQMISINTADIVTVLKR